MTSERASFADAVAPVDAEESTAPMPPACDAVDAAARARSADAAAALEVRWAAATTVWTDPFGLLTQAQRHGRIELVLRVASLTDDSAEVEAVLELGRRSRTIFARQRVRCDRSVQGAMVHLDLHADGQRLASLTLDGSDRPVYAQSCLLEKAGLTGGAYDPPTVRQGSAGADHEPLPR